MVNSAARVRLDSLACEFGEVERSPDSIADLERLRAERKSGLPAKLVDHIIDAKRLCDDETVENVVLVAFDSVASDEDRVQPFALFGDAMAPCLIGRSGPGLTLDGFRVGIDALGLRGSDSFESRKRIAGEAQGTALSRADTGTDHVLTCFSTNFYKPAALFTASLCGIPEAKLAIPTLSRRTHCGNCDWLVDLAEHSQTRGFRAGVKYLPRPSRRDSMPAR